MDFCFSVNFKNEFNQWGKCYQMSLCFTQLDLTFFLSRSDLDMNSTQLQCIHRQKVLLYFQEDPNLKIPLTILYSCLSPLIICANLLLVIGIIKIKRNKFTSCQILFLILFMSDLTIGLVQLPFLIYLLWKTSDLTCFEAQLHAFSASFPIIMSGTLLCAISVDRYINVVFNQYYKRIVTKKSLPVAIIFIILLSLTWAIFETLNQNNADIKTIAEGYIALCGCFAASTVVGVAFNLALLRNVKTQRKNFCSHQILESRLTKTIVMIILLMIAAYLPLMITLDIAGYGFTSSTDNSFTRKRANVHLTKIPCQVNAVLNSVIYLSRCSRMKRYYYKLFNCETVGKCFKRTACPAPSVTIIFNEQRKFHSVVAVKGINRKCVLHSTFHQAQTVSPS